MKWGRNTGRNSNPISVLPAAAGTSRPSTCATSSKPNCRPSSSITSPAAKTVVNNGHAIQVNYGPGSSITIDSTAFALKQFHFHAPSENTINGKSFPLEAHFVHADTKGNLAVVALMFEAGASNKVLEQLWPRVSESEGDEQPLAPLVAATDLLQANRDYYRYSGSLTDSTVFGKACSGWF